MIFDFNYDKPIYIQLAEKIEDEILDGTLKEEEQIPSTNEYAFIYNINPATARKGFSILSDEDIIFKKRGIGMFVSKGGREKIKIKRKKIFYKNFILNAIKEGEKIGVFKDEIIDMILKGESYG